MNKAIDAYITVCFRANNLIDQQTLDEEFGGDLLAWIKILHEEEGIMGIADDNGKIVGVAPIENEVTP